MSELDNSFELQKYLEKLWNLKLSNQKLEGFSFQSKAKRTLKGKPDLLALTSKNELILIEIKSNLNQFKKAKEEINIYVKNIETEKSYDKVYAFAFAGVLSNYKLFFLVKNKNEIREVNLIKFRNLEDLRRIINFNVKGKEIIQQKMISMNNLMRPKISPELRASLLSGLLIAFYEYSNNTNSFRKTYIEYNENELPREIYNSIEKVLENSNLSKEKREAAKSVVRFIKTLEPLKGWWELKIIIRDVISILDELNYINHDIIADAFKEMLRYASGGGKSFGQVMTPTHIGRLMAYLLDRYFKISFQDTFIDNACGTAGLLISVLNYLKDEKEYGVDEFNNFKQNNLFGIELMDNMWLYGLTNMILNGDGKSNIIKDDTFKVDGRSHPFLSKKMDYLITNPPYSLKSLNGKSRTEFAFLFKGLEFTKKGAVIIVPMNIFRKNGIFEQEREKILRNNTLKAILLMDKDTFIPDAAIQPAIIVLEANKPHNFEEDMVDFFEIESDGLVTIKKKGRHDINNFWDLNGEKFTLIKKNLKENKKLLENNSWDFFKKKFKIELKDEDFVDTILERKYWEYNNLKEKGQKDFSFGKKLRNLFQGLFDDEIDR